MATCLCAPSANYPRASASLLYDSHLVYKLSESLMLKLCVMDIQAVSFGTGDNTNPKGNQAQMPSNENHPEKDPKMKLIEEDTYSITRMDKMYSKKRQELLKLVEEFYHAFSSLAKKNDDAVREPL
ncbi:hypothetical protein Nepgr_030420 [Nepenthes gracilis]|uniref:NAB domain-containing protein n=1 Tax=Nepenthes gracilis TaxID=150966 RepID=A0AAD3TGY6_NEPGR|nr:hypothetical protein Nepgr_030420 [Nepenthes gracilis]